MARVLLVVSTGQAGVQKLLVVKEIRPELAHDGEFVTMFMDEARLAARLSHRNIVHTYDVGLDDSGTDPRPFMVMEYLEGQSLQALVNRVRREAMPLEIYLRILTHALAGLHYAHELKDFDGAPLNVVHRDVTPQNVFVCYDGQVKLVDFGIAKASGSAARTEAGTFKGKLGYVAPEQIVGENVDRRADVFSVGVMMWEAIARRRMTAGETEGAVLHKRTHGTQQRIVEVVPDVDPRLALICDRAMALDPNDRYATAADLQADLEAFLDAASMRAGDREIGKLASDAFEAERTRIKGVIEQQLVAISRAGTGSFPSVLPTLGREEHPNSLRTAVRSEPPATIENVIPVHTSSPPPPGSPNTGPTFTVTNPRQRIPRGPAVAIGVVLVLGIGVGLVFAFGGAKPADTKVPGSGSASVTAATVSPPTAGASTGTLTVTATPASAKLLLDGQPLAGNPYRGAIPHDGSTHVLTVSADHYGTETRKLVYDGDVAAIVSLRETEPQRWTGTRPPVVPPPPPSGTVTATPPPTATATGTTTAGSDIAKDPKHTHGIDEKDPY
jgi:serine/threonine-protein kinase